jgi:long-chain acyl-CoA synthetase
MPDARNEKMAVVMDHTSSVLASSSEAPPLFEKGKWVWERHYPQGLGWRAPIFKKPVHHILDKAAETFAEHILCDHAGKNWTYGEIHAATMKAARGLQDLGVQKGDRVGLFMPNSPFAIIFYFAILKVGATVVNYNPLYADRELAGQITDSGTKIMVTLDQPGLIAKMQTALSATALEKIILCPLAQTLPALKVLAGRLTGRLPRQAFPSEARFVPYRAVTNNNGTPDFVEIETERDIAVLQYTGGTTGIPKGAMLTHANLYANMYQLTTWVKSMEPGRETVLCALPLFHVFAMTVVMNMGVHNGMKILLHPKFDINAVFADMKKHRPTMLPGVPAIFGAIANAPGVEKVDFSSLKFCISGGAPMPADVQRLFQEKTGSTAIAEGYGLTEAAPGVTFNPCLGRRKPGTVGQPLPGTIVEILSLEDGVTPCGIGQKGEVCVSGPQVMRGYFNKPEATGGVMRGGRLHTGDVGFIDAEGYLTLVDRIKDLILVRGYNVYPRMVEEAIYMHPAVEECIVAGVPDAERGETVHAWVKVRAGKTASEKELQEFLQDKISPIEIPRRIFLRDTPLPKTAVGKLSRKDLLAQEGISK